MIDALILDISTIVHILAINIFRSESTFPSFAKCRKFPDRFRYSSNIHSRTTDEKRNRSVTFPNRSTIEPRYSDFNRFFPRRGDAYFLILIHISALIVPFFSSSHPMQPFCFPFFHSHPFLFHYSVILYLTVLRNFIFILLFSYIFLL